MYRSRLPRSLRQAPLAAVQQYVILLRIKLNVMLHLHTIICGSVHPLSPHPHVFVPAVCRIGLTANQPTELLEGLESKPSVLAASLNKRLLPRVSRMMRAGIEPVFSRDFRAVAQLTDAQFKVSHGGTVVCPSFVSLLLLLLLL